MGEVKHTPGPWFWALDKHDQRTNLMRSGSGSYVLTPEADVGNYGLSVDRWTDISDADARLISAAPDMYEALQGLTEMLGRPQGIDPDRVRPLYDTALAALASAKRGG